MQVWRARSWWVLTVVAVAACALPWTATADPFEAAGAGMTVFTDRDGLPQNSVESMALDSTGRLWVTTREGMAVYDGTEWSAVPLPATSPSNWPRQVVSSRDGSLWIGAEQGGLYQVTSGEWRRFGVDEGLADEQVRVLREVEFRGAATLLAGTPSGLSVWLPEEQRFLAYAWSRHQEITAIEATVDAVWIGTAERGLHRWDGGRWTKHEPPAGSELRVTALLDSRLGLLVGTNQGLYRYERDIWSPIAPDQLGPVKVSSMLETDDALWIGTEGGGVQVLRSGDWNTLDVTSGLPNNFVFDLFGWPPQNPELVFAGTLSGLAQIDTDGWRVIDLARAVPDRSVVSFLEATRSGEKIFWTGTTHGLAVFRNGEWQPSLRARPVFAMIETPGGVIYAGSDTGLYRSADGEWTAAGPGLPESAVVALARDENASGERLWVGTYGAGIWVSDGGRFRRAANLPDDRVEVIAPLSLGQREVVAVGTNRGLVLIGDGEVTTVDSSSGLPGDVVRSIHVRRPAGAPAELWIGTGNGVARSPLREPLEWTVFQDTSWLPSSTVYRIEEDSLGRLYFFTSRGIGRIELDEQGAVSNSRTYTTADGLPSNEVNFGATMVDSSGRIWVGTPTGAAILDPALEREDPPGRLVIREVSVGRERVPVQPAYQLASDQRSLSVSFRLIDLDGGGRAQYRTHLVGAEDGPGGWSRATSVDFAGLAPGDYTLRIEARDDRGVEVEPVVIPIEIAAPLWSRWWAILGYVVLVIVLIRLLIERRERRLRRRTVQLEKLVESRTRDLERSNRELEAANRSLSDLTETDPLTGAKNRRWVALHMPSEAVRVIESSRRGDDLILLLVDIDHFKAVNDQFGHPVGDAVLRRFETVLRRTVRDTDTIVRWGGEEFLILARRTTRDEASLIAGRIVDEVRREPFESASGEEIRLTCSVGAAAFPFDLEDRRASSWEEVLAMTDLCLYAVKRSGRDGWILLRRGEAPLRPDLAQRMRANPSAVLKIGEVQAESSFDEATLVWE